jgi:hypothetical protein
VRPRDERIDGLRGVLGGFVLHTPRRTWLVLLTAYGSDPAELHRWLAAVHGGPVIDATE